MVTRRGSMLRGNVCKPACKPSLGKLHPVYEDNCRTARVIIALDSSVVVYAESVLRLFDEESQ